MLALDASNGEILWRYQYTPTGAVEPEDGAGAARRRVFVPTSDLHVLALNARTGELVWNHEIATASQTSARSRYQMRGAPLVVGDKVIQGVTASFVAGGGFIVGARHRVGKELWRFHTIARPGEPGGNSWNGLPLDKRSGGSVWHQGTYDAEPEPDLLRRRADLRHAAAAAAVGRPPA